MAAILDRPSTRAEWPPGHRQVCQTFKAFGGGGTGRRPYTRQKRCDERSPGIRAVVVLCRPCVFGMARIAHARRGNDMGGEIRIARNEAHPVHSGDPEIPKHSHSQSTLVAEIAVPPSIVCFALQRQFCAKPSPNNQYRVGA